MCDEGSNAVLESTRPSVEIIEEPTSKPIRFRYACERNCFGTIFGIHNNETDKSYPKITIRNYKGPVWVNVSCVTNEKPHMQHPHKLHGKDCEDGVYKKTIYFDGTFHELHNLGIQCVKRNEVQASLDSRRKMNIDPFNVGFSKVGFPKDVKLNELRLCIQVFIEDPCTKKLTRSLPPVITEIIYDKRANKDLTISRISHCSGSMEGGLQIILLCEKVSREDVKVKFYKEINGNEVWKEYGTFNSKDVHKQVAITFRTPAYTYKNKILDKPVKVWIQLERPSDKSVGESVEFEYYPSDLRSGELTYKRQRTNTSTSPVSPTRARSHCISPRNNSIVMNF